jgi:hypothetical protein
MLIRLIAAIRAGGHPRKLQPWPIRKPYKPSLMRRRCPVSSLWLRCATLADRALLAALLDLLPGDALKRLHLVVRPACSGAG